jgi:integrase
MLLPKLGLACASTKTKGGAANVSGKRRGKRVVSTDGTVQVRGKNANGEGSVYQTADGRWVATWSRPGDKRPRKATGKTREMAMRRRTQRQKEEAAAEETANRSGMATVGELAQWWRDHVQRHAVKIQSWHTSRSHVARIVDTLGEVLVEELDYMTVTAWQAKLLESLAPKTVRLHRETLAQVMDEAVKTGTIKANPVRSVRPPAAPWGDFDALDADEIQALVDAARHERLGAAVAVLFNQGWRVSEVLGLADEDLYLDEDLTEPAEDLAQDPGDVAGRAVVRRKAIYITGQGMELQPYTKALGSMGEYWLQSPVVELLRERLEVVRAERRENFGYWPTHTCDGQSVNLLFVREDNGGILHPRHIAAAVRRCVKAAGLDAHLGTHGGRRSVVTSMWSEGHESLENIAQYVGHRSPNSTSRYVKKLGKRPKAIADRASRLFVQP